MASSPVHPTLPAYGGGSLINLIAEVEARLTGTSPSPRLADPVASRVPAAAGYVVVLFDGLGAAQLDHPAAAGLRSALAAVADAPFPTTTTVSLASVATALPPSRHGLLGYQLWVPEVDAVVNTIRWTTLWGADVDHDTTGFLPGPNLWERISAAGLEAITVQPAGFEDSPMSRMLYRGCRFEGVSTYDDLVTATVQLAAPGRLVFVYVPQVDFAAHVAGQASEAYDAAVRLATNVWEGIARRLPAGVAAIGTADHGHVDFPPERQTRLTTAEHKGRTFYGDGRAMFVKGEGESLADRLPATWWPIDAVGDWWGPGPRHATFADRAPDGILLAEPGHLLLHRFSDDRMVGNHGGLTDEERLIPVLVAGG